MVMHTKVYTTALTILTGIVLLTGLPTQVHAATLEAGTAASMTVDERIVAKTDTRVTKLTSYLEARNSPLTPYAGFFISEADRLGLDWKLVVAISGVESTFGRFIPANSFNGWGWGIFTGKQDGIHFSSWADGITTVSEGLRYNYVNKGAVSVEQMGRIYAASPTWASKVRFFMNQIDQWEEKTTSTDSTLSMLTL